MIASMDVGVLILIRVFKLESRFGFLDAPRIGGNSSVLVFYPDFAMYL